MKTLTKLLLAIAISLSLIAISPTALAAKKAQKNLLTKQEFDVARTNVHVEFQYLNRVLKNIVITNNGKESAKVTVFLKNHIIGAGDNLTLPIPLNTETVAMTVAPYNPKIDNMSGNQSLSATAHVNDTQVFWIIDYPKN